MQVPDVDLIIPVHSSTRPIRRAVASVLAGSMSRIRVNVVAHNIDPEIIRTNLAEYAERADVRVLALQDGIPSPSGPMNHGIASATASYFGVMGSDDELRPGAVDSWLALARRTRASVVIARVEDESGRAEPTPAARRGRTRDLDPVVDRLSYRCMPLGLIANSEFQSLRFSPALKSGEDLEFTARLWFTAARISYDRTGPAYLVHSDAQDRITTSLRPVPEDFAFLDFIAKTPWFREMSAAQKRALAVKNLRVHLLDAIAARLDSIADTESLRTELLAVAERIESLGPGAIALLSRADRDVLDELREEHPQVQRIRDAISARWSRGPRALLPRNPLLALHGQAPLRTLRNMVV